MQNFGGEGGLASFLQINIKSRSEGRIDIYADQLCKNKGGGKGGMASFRKFWCRDSKSQSLFFLRLIGGVGGRGGETI